MKSREPKLAKPKPRCGACNGRGAIVCSRCGGQGTQTSWRRQVTACMGCGGTGEQACIICKQMGTRERKS